MTRRQDNPVLEWLGEEATWQYYAHWEVGDNTTAHIWDGRCDVYEWVRCVCRWLDAEDEWALNLQYIRDGNKHLDWVMWREARMAEAGVL